MRLKLFFFLIILFFFTSHLSYIQNGFTWLDHGDIEQKIAIKKLTSFQEIFFQPYAHTTFYRPTLTFFLSLNYFFSDTNAVGYHLTNLILMCVIAITSPFFLSKFLHLTNREKIIVSLVLCVHPLTWLSSGSISYRPELLVILFSEIFILFHAYHRVQNNIVFHYLALLFLLLALFSKETAFILLPFLVIGYEYINKKNKVRSYLFYLEEILCVGIFLMLRYEVVGTIWPAKYYNWNVLEQIGTRIVVMGKLLLLLVTPIIPSFSDATKIVSFTNWPSILCFTIISLILVVGIISKDPYIRLGILYTFILLTPGFNIFSLPRFFSPHYALFSLIPSTLIFIGLYHNLSKIGRVLFLVIFFPFFILMSYQISVGGFRFKTDYTLFYPEVIKDSHFLEGQYYLGDYYYNQKDYSEAESFYKKSLRRDSKIIAYIDQPSAQIKLADLFRKKGKLDDALTLLNKAETSSSPFYKDVIHYDKAILYFENQQYEKSLVELRARTTNWNTDINSVNLLVSIYLKQHKKKEAIEFLDTILNDSNTKMRQSTIELKKRIETN